MAVLLDTDTISATLKPRPDVAVLRRLALLPPREVSTSSVTVGELLYGLLRRPQVRLGERIELIIRRMAVLPFDEDAARDYAEIKTHLERLGTPLAEPDLRIAAIARSWNLTLVTGNVRHFARVPGLPVENWLSPGE
jgi:tRNA(fMet)-specific endonuclease VapC